MNILPYFFMEIARKVQILKFWCLKSSTNIWLSFGNLNSIPKVKNIELEQKEGSKLSNSLKKFMKQDRCSGRDARAGWRDSTYMIRVLDQYS